MTHKNHFITLFAKYSQTDFEYNEADFSNINWEGFYSFLESHRLVGVVFPVLKKLDVIPALHIEKFRVKNSIVQKQTLLQAAELQRLATLLEKHQISMISFKGLALGHQYYENYTQREAKDIDILIRQQDIEKTCQLLKLEGYDLLDVLWNTPKQKRLYLQNYYHYCLYNPNNFIQIEIHWRFSNFESNLLISRIWDRAITYRVRSFSFLTLDKQDNFLFLCDHGFRHQWKRLFWTYDLYKIILKEGNIFLEDTLELAKNNNQTLPFLSACYLVRSFFGVRLPQCVSKEFEKNYVIERLCDIAFQFIDGNQVIDKNPFKNWQNFNTSLKKNIFNYASTIHLYGLKFFIFRLRLSLINPKYWTIYSFSDNLFVMNYLIAPFLWLSFVLKKINK